MADRRSVYFRKGKDKDLVKYINKLLDKHDFSEIARGLMRDGIKYRRIKHNNSTHTPTPESHYEIIKSTVPQAPKPVNHTPISDIELIKKEVSREDLSNRLDEF